MTSGHQAFSTTLTDATYRTSWERETGIVMRCVGGLHDCSQGTIRITISEDNGGLFDSGRHRWGQPWCQPQGRGR